MKIRLLIGALVFTATMVSYMLRVGLNIAIVTMTDIDNKTLRCQMHDDNYRYMTCLFYYHA